MWKILCITFICHLTQAENYVEHGKVTELKIMPNNGVLEYNEEKGELKVLVDIGTRGDIDRPFYYDYYYENLQTGEGGSGTDRLCGNSFNERKREDQRLHFAILLIFRGEERCPLFTGYTYKVKKDFLFLFTDTTDGLFINCGNNTAEITLTGITGKENIGEIVFDYYLTGPKCDK